MQTMLVNFYQMAIKEETKKTLLNSIVWLLQFCNSMYKYDNIISNVISN